MPSSFVLGLETSTPWGGVALARTDGRLLGHVWAHARTGYSRRLMPTVDRLLRDHCVQPRNLAALAVTHGPGSFTGVRLGLVTAKTLARCLEIPLFTFSTLEAVASRWPLHDRPIAVVLDARRREIYGGVYRRRPDGGLESLRPEAAAPPSAFFEALGSAGFGPLWLAGDAVEKTRSLWTAILGDGVRPVDSPWGLPAAASVARLGARAGWEGRTATDPLAAAPHYLRVSDAHRTPAGSRRPAS